ncbi:MAG: thioredoxin-like domain-containing protein [Flavisolibacter sp.]
MKIIKKTSAVILCSLLVLAGCTGSESQSKNEGYTVKGTIKGVQQGTIKLVNYNEDDRTSTTVDSAEIKNGSFEMRGQLDAAQMATVMIEPGNLSFAIFLENKPLTITVDTAGSNYYDYTMYGGDKGGSIKNFTETGSQNFDDWTKYQNDPGQKKYEPVFADLSQKIQTTKDVDQQYRYRDQMDSVRKILNGWKAEQVKNYIDKNPSSVAGAYMLRDLYTWYTDLPFGDMQAMVTGFRGEAKQSKYYKSLEDILAKRKAVMPGSIAPDFTLLKRDSSRFTLSSTRGKYMMIDFWASWCHPCRQAIPHWKEVYAKYHDKGFDIVSVSDDSKWKDWFKAMDQEKMPWAQVCDEFPLKNMPARIGSLYMTTYIPFYVLLDKDGKILVYSGDESKIDEKLTEVFGS